MVALRNRLGGTTQQIWWHYATVVVALDGTIGVGHGRIDRCGSGNVKLKRVNLDVADVAVERKYEAFVLAGVRLAAVRSAGSRVRRCLVRPSRGARP